MGGGKDERWYVPILLNYRLHAHKVEACSSLYKKAAAYHVTTDKGDFLLKPFIGSHSRLHRVYSRIDWLRSNGFRSMPKWLKTADGQHSVSRKGRLYYVTQWIDGTELGDTTDDYVKMGEVLAQLHLISKRRDSAHGPYSSKQITRLRDTHRAFVQHLAVIKARGSSRWFRKKGDECVSLAEEAWRTLRHSDIQRLLQREEPCLIHGDVTIPNIIKSRNGVYLIDWEFTRYGSAYYELAKTLNNISHYSLPHLNALLSGYENISPLKAEERLIIASLFRLPREAWIAAAEMRLGKTAAVYTILKKGWARRIEAVEWLDRWAAN